MSSTLISAIKCALAQLVEPWTIYWALFISYSKKIKLYGIIIKEISKMNKFVKAVQDSEMYTRTENNAVQLRTTDSKLLDLFGTIGAMREKSEHEIITAFKQAFNENPVLAVRMAFYARNIREGGLGERRVFRVILKWLATNYAYIVNDNISLIPAFGRWDDLFVLADTPCEPHLIYMINEQLKSDMKSEKPSLLARHMPSESASSRKTKDLAKFFIEKLRVTPKYYRTTLTALRKKIGVVESKMSSGQWDKISYERVPSLAMKNYRSAFGKHDSIRFGKYIEDVTNNKNKINSSTLYPYDIVRSYNNFYTRKLDPVLEAQWKALPNYIEDTNNVLVIADTSGSMIGRPLDTACGLAVYFAERNSGPFRNLFMTFSSKPEYVFLKGESLAEKLGCFTPLVDNTNIQAAFELVLKTAVENNLSQEDLPKALLVISDMEFDEAQSGFRRSTEKWNNIAFNVAKREFNEMGYELPKIVFWNVSQRTTGFQVKSNQDGVILVSGNSTGTFRDVLTSISSTPYDYMVEVLNKEPYTNIVVNL